jgi:general secretion pathway protein A
MILGVLLDKVLSLAYPVEEAAIHQYAGLIFAIQHQHSSVQPTDGFCDLLDNKLNEVLFETMFARKRFVLVVDEAQNLKNSVLETVRMLSNFETHHTKLLQIVLAGQPKLAAKLAQPQLSQLRQRIAVLSHLEPFTAAETARYVDHRLKVAGYCGKPLFEPSAVSLIAQRSQGIPRNINNVCYNSLLLAYVRGDATVTEGLVRRAIEAAGLARRR